MTLHNSARVRLLLAINHEAGRKTDLGYQHQVDAGPQREAVHGVRHHGIQAVFAGDLQEDSAGGGGVRQRKLQGLQAVLPHLGGQGPGERRCCDGSAEAPAP